MSIGLNAFWLLIGLAPGVVLVWALRNETSDKDGVVLADPKGPLLLIAAVVTGSIVAHLLIAILALAITRLLDLPDPYEVFLTADLRSKLDAWTFLWGVIFFGATVILPAGFVLQASAARRTEFGRKARQVFPFNLSSRKERKGPTNLASILRAAAREGIAPLATIEVRHALDGHATIRGHVIELHPEGSGIESMQLRIGLSSEGNVSLDEARELSTGGGRLVALRGDQIVGFQLHLPEIPIRQIEPWPPAFWINGALIGTLGGLQASGAIVVVAMFISLPFGGQDAVFLPSLGVGIIALGIVAGRVWGKTGDACTPSVGAFRTRKWMGLGGLAGLGVVLMGLAGPVFVSQLGYRTAADALLVFGYFGLPALFGGVLGGVLNSRSLTRDGHQGSD